jgi:torulene dioxygenase
VLQQFDTVTLEPIEIFTYSASGGGIGQGMTSAHPGVGGEGMWDQGAVYNYLLDITAEPPVYQVFGIQPNGEGKVLANITDAPPAYIHSIFSTENYVIMIIWQCDFGPPSKENSGILDLIMPWNPERPVYFYVIDKKAGGVVAKYKTSKSFFAFHEVNSFEENGDIVVDIPTMPDASWLEAARMESLRSGLGNSDSGAFDLQSIFQRYRLSDFANSKIENGTVLEREAVLDFELPAEIGGLELPRINEAYLRKPHRFVYGIHTEKRGYFMDSIVKIDTKTQTSKIWSPETNHVPSEPIFVARPGSKGEDDGVLLTMALDAATSKSNLVVIDAKDMREMGRAKMPIAAGYGFHGIWGQERIGYD